MKKNYYCLVAGLPDWKPDDKKSPISWNELRDEIRSTLDGTDLRLAEMFLLPHDHANIIAALYKTGAPFDAKGKYSEAEIEQFTDMANLDDNHTAEPYIAQAIAQYYAQEPRPAQTAFAATLQNGWNQMLAKSGNAFVQGYAQFDNTLRNMLVALQSRKYGYDMADNIIGNDENAQNIRRSKAHDFGLRGEFEYADAAMQIFETQNLVEREMKIDALKWNYIDQETFFHYFGVERVIAAMLKLGMVERWAALDAQNGQRLFGEIISGIKQSYNQSKK